MDALRLLTRATKLSKQIARGSEPGNDNINNKKRKRGIGPSRTIPSDRDVDFFKDQSRKHEESNKHDDGRNHQVNGNQTVKNIVQDSDSRAANLDFAECRKVLKQHKLKITQIWPDAQEERTSKKRRGQEENDAPKKKKRKLEITPQPLASFQQLHSRYGAANRICENLLAQGYAIPTEIQSGSLPLLLDSKYSSMLEEQADTKGKEFDNNGPAVDLLAVAPTGSGKTLAFLIPVLNSLMRARREGNAENGGISRRKANSKGPQAIIIAPTKELASQIVNEGRKLARNTGVRIALVRKGSRIHIPSDENMVEAEDEESMSVDSEHSKGSEDGSSSSSSSAAAAAAAASDQEGEEFVQKGSTAMKAEILVSTPLALVHALSSSKGDNEARNNTCVRYLVLDEADVLLDPLFRAQTMSIWRSCRSPALRVTFWSATMGSSIEELALSTLSSHGGEDGSRSGSVLRIVVGLKDSAIPRNINHKLIYSATEAGKLLALRNLLRPTASTPTPTPTVAATSSNSNASADTLRPPFLVFTQTIARASALHAELLYDIPVHAGGSARLAVLHAGLSERARDSVMTRFRRGEIWVLITTDLLSRGVDFRGVNGVVNYDMPTSSAAYVHRVGRTGRAGRTGCTAVTLYADEDVPFLKNVTNVLAAASGAGASADARTELGGDATGTRTATGMASWLADALPRPSRREKQMLRKRGIESRRPSAPPSKLNRISTKSGFDRRRENRRNAAIAASLLAKKKKSNNNNNNAATSSGAGEGEDDDEFEEFSDED